MAHGAYSTFIELHNTIAHGAYSTLTELHNTMAHGACELITLPSPSFITYSVRRYGHCVNDLPRSGYSYPHGHCSRHRYPPQQEYDYLVFSSIYHDLKYIQIYSSNILNGREITRNFRENQRMTAILVFPGLIRCLKSYSLRSACKMERNGLLNVEIS